MTIEITVRDNENKWRWNSWAILPSSPEPEPTSVREKERKEREQTHLLIKDNFWEDFATTDKAGLLLNNIFILCVSVCVSDLACVCVQVSMCDLMCMNMCLCVCALCMRIHLCALVTSRSAQSRTHIRNVYVIMFYISHCSICLCGTSFCMPIWILLNPSKASSKTSSILICLAIRLWKGYWQTLIGAAPVVKWAARSVFDIYPCMMTSGDDVETGH